MIDLHIHTVYSDGTYSVIEILEEAEKKKLKYISITDHDKCNAYYELKNIDIKKYFSGKIINGIEIKCSYKGRLIEILGYNYDLEKISKWIAECYKDKQAHIMQEKYFNILYDRAKSLDLTMTEKEKIIWNPSNDWASVVIYKDIKKYKGNKEKLPEDLWQDFSTFTKKYCSNPQSIWYIDKTKDYPTLEEGIRAIKNSDGLVFLPHLFIYKWAEDKEEFINELITNYKVDGIECYHSTFDNEQINYLLKLCSNNNLYMSGGSDFHGENKPDIQLGFGKGNLQISENIIKDWIKDWIKEK